MNPLKLKLRIDKNSIKKLCSSITKNNSSKNYPKIKFNTTKCSPEKVNTDKQLFFRSQNQFNKNINNNIPLKTDNFTEKDIEKFFKKKSIKKN